MYSQTNLCFSRTQKLAEIFLCTASVLQKSNFLFQIRRNLFFLSALSNLTALEPRVKIFYKWTSILSITLSTDPSTKNKLFSVKKRAKLAKKMNRENKRKSMTFLFFLSRDKRGDLTLRNKLLSPIASTDVLIITWLTRLNASQIFSHAQNKINGPKLLNHEFFNFFFENLDFCTPDRRALAATTCERTTRAAFVATRTTKQDG